MNLEEWDKSCRQKFDEAKKECVKKMNSWPASLVIGDKRTNAVDAISDWLYGITLATLGSGYSGNSLVLNFPTTVVDSIESSKKLQREFGFNSTQTFQIEITYSSNRIVTPATTLATGTTATAATDITIADVVGSCLTEIKFRRANNAWNNYSTLPLDPFLAYRKKISLQNVPVNLHGDIIFHLIATLGGHLTDYWYSSSNTSDGSSNSGGHHLNLLHFEKSHLFPGSFECMPQLLSANQKSTNKNAEQGGWISVELDYVVVGSNLLFERKYRDTLIAKLYDYQVYRLIDHFFRWRKDSIGRSNSAVSTKLIAAARGFLADLIFAPIGEKHIKNYDIKIRVSFLSNTVKEIVLAFGYPDYLAILSLEKIKSTIDIVDVYNIEGSNLTIDDIGWIISVFAEAKRDSVELKMRITESSYSEYNYKFPTMNDRFDSFDPQLLTGLLAETRTSRKLAIHDRNIIALRQSVMESTSPVPNAVADLMESYLSIDFGR